MTSQSEIVCILLQKDQNQCIKLNIYHYVLYEHVIIDHFLSCTKDVGINDSNIFYHVPKVCTPNIVINTAMYQRYVHQI